MVLIITNPSFLSKPAAQTAGLGLFQAFDPLDFEKTIGPTKRKLPLDHVTKPAKLLIEIYALARASQRAPSQANMSQTFALDKKKGLLGVPGLRLLHAFCPWWRGFYRRIVNSEGPFSSARVGMRR
eukprot:8593064-Pyramimonas_sp.AAC.1